MLFGHVIPARKQPGKHSSSENDWAWVSCELTRGKDAVKLTRELAARRFDKPNPLYYAQRTVDVASARHWLIEGVRIDNVITMLESRRRFELPTALCSARAREPCRFARSLMLATVSAKPTAHASRHTFEPLLDLQEAALVLGMHWKTLEI